MNLKDNHLAEKPVSTFSLFKGEGLTVSIQLLKQQKLKEHISKVPALLVCVIGEVVFENEQGLNKKLESGNYIAIESNVKHEVVALADSQLLIMK